MDMIRNLNPTVHPDDVDGITAAKVALDLIFHATCAAGVINILLSLFLHWILPPYWNHLITVLCLLTGVFLLWYFKKTKIPCSRMKAFMKLLESGDIGHRGGAADAPENTIMAIRQAKQNGATAVEVDVEMTKDGVAVLMHDATVDRTTDGAGFIGQLLCKDVKKLNAAAKFSSRSQLDHESVPKLEEAIQECMILDLKIFFDVKAYSKQMVQTLVSLYEKYPELYKKAIVCSFYPTTIYMVRQLDSDILTALTVEPLFITLNVEKSLSGPARWWKLMPFLVLDKLLVWSMYSWLWILCGNSAMLLHKDMVSQSAVSYWSARGLVVVPWTVNTRIEKDFCTQMGCHYITDCVKKC